LRGPHPRHPAPHGPAPQPAAAGPPPAGAPRLNPPSRARSPRRHAARRATLPGVDESVRGTMSEDREPGERGRIGPFQWALLGLGSIFLLLGLVLGLARDTRQFEAVVNDDEPLALGQTFVPRVATVVVDCGSAFHRPSGVDVHLVGQPSWNACTSGPTNRG